MVFFLDNIESLWNWRKVPWYSDGKCIALRTDWAACWVLIIYVSTRIEDSLYLLSDIDERTGSETWFISLDDVRNEEWWCSDE